MLGRLGLVEEVLGMPVFDSGGRVFYLAADRPRQLRRAMRRFARPEWREVFADRLVLHEGPLPVDITTPAGKDWVADQAQHHKADTVIVDSVKDVCPSPSEDGPANGYNLARQECIARRIEWLEGHHNRKASDGNRKPNKLDDVYGSRWLTGGAGSVLCLWGEAGDRIIELTQLKSPAGYFNPTQVEINFSTGGLSIPGSARTAIGTAVSLTTGAPRSVLEALARGPEEGMTAKRVAEMMQRTEAAVRKQLERHVTRAEVYRDDSGERVHYRMTGHTQEEIDRDAPWANLSPNTNT
jgi:replicative DNA helicase